MPLVVKNPLASAGNIRNTGLITGLERSPRGGNGNPLQYSCLGNPTDRAWQATAHSVTKSRTQLSDLRSQYYFSYILHGNIEISAGTNNFLKTKQFVKILFLLYHNSYFKMKG